MTDVNRLPMKSLTFDVTRLQVDVSSEAVETGGLKRDDLDLALRTTAVKERRERKETRQEQRLVIGMRGLIED